MEKRNTGKKRIHGEKEYREYRNNRKTRRTGKQDEQK